ncbi:SusE domain-containing protein [Chitinophagaceae bacterium MMS25-I14]
MKRIFNIVLLMGAAILLTTAGCKKDETKTKYNASNAKATLTSSASSVVLTAADAAEQVIAFSWARVDFGYNAVVSYSLQFDVPADSFKTPQTKAIGTNVYTQGYSVGDINQLAIGLNMLPDSVSVLAVRLVAQVNEFGGATAGLAPVYSQPVDIKVKPYTTVKVYPALYVPGDYQGWDPGSAPSILSLNSDSKYEGYIYIKAGTLEFKFTTKRDWSGTNFGLDGTSTTTGVVTSGLLSTNGGAGNLKVPGEAYYKINVDTAAHTFSLASTNWGVIGDATPQGWNASTPMTYDASSQTWIADPVQLTVGAIKFRANDAWDYNYGYDAQNNFVFNSPNNIPVTVAGSYKITLDLSNPAHYTFKLDKH